MNVLSLKLNFPCRDKLSQMIINRKGLIQKRKKWLINVLRVWSLTASLKNARAHGDHPCVSLQKLTDLRVSVSIIGILVVNHCTRNMTNARSRVSY